jgi:hypothetical protein
MAVFQQQLPQYLSEALTPANLANILSGGGGKALPASAINTKQAQFLGVSTNQTLDCTGAFNVSITMTFSANLTLTLTNLTIGAGFLLDVKNTAGGARTLTMAATAPGGTPYVVIKGNTSAAVNNFIAGMSIVAGAEFIFVGQSTTGPNLVMVGN